MGVCIGHESALRYWLTKRWDEAIPEAAENSVLGRASAGARTLRATELPFCPGEGQTLHLLVPHRRLGHVARGISPHVLGAQVPEGSFYRLSGDSAVASPELTFALLAGRRSITDVVRIGCHLCSTFATDETGRGYAGEREQIVDADSLRRYLAALPPHTRGVRRGMDALAYVVERLASPMEVVLAMFFGMPPQLGGWGPFSLLANERIETDDTTRTLIGSGHLRTDLFFTDYAADLEYDSREFHTGAQRLDRTSARRNALEALGIKTISATYGQLNTFGKLTEFARMLHRRLELDPPSYTFEQQQAQMRLYCQLMPPGDPLF